MQIQHLCLLPILVFKCRSSTSDTFYHMQPCPYHVTSALHAYLYTETVFTDVQVTIKVVLTKICYVNLGYDNLTIQLLLLKSAAVTILKCTLFFLSTFLTQHSIFKRVQTGESLLKSKYTSYWPDAVQLWNSVLTLNKDAEYVL